MPTLIEAKTENSVASFQQCRKDNLVRGGAGMRLHVRVLCAEGFYSPFLCQSLKVVNKLAAPMEPGAGETLGRLVLDNRTESRQDRS